MDSTTVAVQRLIAWALPVLLAITVREVAHGWAAYALSNRSTRMMLGRPSLNPLKYVDPIGTLLVPGVLLLLPRFFLFGWAKPAPIDLRGFSSPRMDLALVALTGPLSSLAMAILWAILLRQAGQVGASQGLWYGIGMMAEAGLTINVSLMALHLIPLPPLDGSRILMGLLPERAAAAYAELEPYGMYILLGLTAVPGLLAGLLYWPTTLTFTAIGRLVGLEFA
jgi:Zn-dependent protease